MGGSAMALKIGSKGVDFHLQGVDGKRYSLSSFEDKKIVVVIISCNHCPTVVAYEDRMMAIQRDYERKGVALVAINPNDETRYPMDSFDNMVKRAHEWREPMEPPGLPRCLPWTAIAAWPFTAALMTTSTSRVWSRATI
jgi:cytochrome oxidase Cu insertion factor (SCO1/SenC/PrrC family)